MKLKVFAVFDSKAQAWNTPMFLRSTGEALRSWEDECNRVESMISKHAEDYSLHELGEYDDSTGRFQELPSALNLGLAASFRKPEVSRTARLAPAPEITQ